MAKAQEELQVMKLSPQDQKGYKAYLESLSYDASIHESTYGLGKIEGIEEGIGVEKGKIEGKIEIAKEMIKDGESNAKIAKYTGLTFEQIDALRKEMGLL